MSFQVLEFYHDVIQQLYLNHIYFLPHLDHDDIYPMFLVFLNIVELFFSASHCCRMPSEDSFNFVNSSRNCSRRFYLPRPFPYAMPVPQFQAA